MKRVFALYYVMVLAALTWAAPGAWTMRFSRVPLSQAIRTIEHETGYTLVYNATEVDMQHPVSANLENADINEILDAVLGSDYSYTVKSSLVTITPAPEKGSSKTHQPITNYPTYLDTRYRDSIIARADTSYITRVDSSLCLRDTSWQQPIDPEEPMPTEATHRLMIGAGAGYGQMGYATENTSSLSLRQSGGFAGQADVRYAYFWNKHWGVSLGLGLDYYSGAVTMNGFRAYEGWTDTDHEPCTWQVQPRALKETQKGLVFGIPVMLHYEYVWRSIGVYAAAGMRVAMPVFSRYAGVSGEVAYTGYYDKWHLTLDDVYDYSHDAQYRSGALRTQAVTAAVQAEAGVVIPLRASSVTIGAYANVVANNAIRPAEQSFYTDKGLFYPEDYAGVHQSDQIHGAHPWQVGVRVTYAWHWPAKAKQQPTEYETVSRTDSTWRVTEHTDTLATVIYDTLRIAEQVTLTPADSAYDYRGAVTTIFFGLDKAVPESDATECIDSVAQSLVAHPDWRIEITGHTCTLGSKAYNDRLSLRRAEAIAAMLRRRGVKEEQMLVRGCGYSLPKEDGAHDIALDRRVEIKQIR